MEKMKETTLSFMDAEGNIEFNMTNNYMFRYVLQENLKVLKGLICALLHLTPEMIKSIEIQNPIDLANAPVGKEFILDIQVMLNDDALINLEMQVANENNWPERSLSYLCRAFDHLYRGQEYEEAYPVIHIGFLDYTLFPEFPEFYATYKLFNEKNFQCYSSKFVLSVVNLKRTDLATLEDKEYGIDYWARLFKAKTWEELKMLAKDNEYLKEAAGSIYRANADEIVRQQCRAREDAERLQRTLQRDKQLLKAAVDAAKAEADAAKAEADAAKAEADAAKAEADAAKAEADAAKAEVDAAKAEADAAKEVCEKTMVENDVLRKRIAELEAEKKKISNR